MSVDYRKKNGPQKIYTGSCVSKIMFPLNCNNFQIIITSKKSVTNCHLEQHHI